MMNRVIALAFVLTVVKLASGQDQTQACAVNQLWNGQICTCAPGYFSSENEESTKRCEDECEEVYSSYFTYGACVKNLFDRVAEDQQPACNMRCGVKLYWWSSVGLFVIAAAALATLFFTIPLCIASCCSCLQARKAHKNTKRIYTESQAQPGKDQLATMSYNPYAYWPYYGRQ